VIKDEYGNPKFFGVYRGVVLDNTDPLNAGRLRLQIPQVLGETPTGWAWGVYSTGVVSPLPAVGSGVFVMFEGGDLFYPIWCGTFSPTVAPVNYGSFIDYRTDTQQTSTTGAQPIELNTTLGANNVSITNNGSGKPTRITFANSGLFNIQFSAQLHQASNGSPSVDIWIRQNDADVPQSTGTVDLSNQMHYSLPSWNYLQQITAGDYIEFYWTSTSTVQILSTPTQSSPTVPETPGMTVTVTEVK
jgi:Type VI secretion system/phage-baseplate injector OB domain